MKYIFGTFIICFFACTASAQYALKGKILNAESKQPIEGVTISLIKDNSTTVNAITDNKGDFTIVLKKRGDYELSAGHVGMKTVSRNLNIAEALTIINIDLIESPYFLEPLEIKSVRAADKAPFTKTNLSKEEIASNNLGQDLPFLLNQTPSVVINSDAGNGVGYTGIRIRGSDATRINVTLNGIPYNDPESQGTFFVDLPDVASSLNSIQIQRGVGTSSNGAGAFGATVNLSTNEFNEKAYGEINNSFGSFNTKKHTLKVGTGLIGDHFTIDARVSKISSDGFIDRASSNLKSLYLSTAYYTKKSSLRFNIITGKEKTYQSWYGIPESKLNTNRTYNSAGTAKPGEPYNNETDNYQQDHYQLFFNHAFTSNLSFNTAFFLTKGSGYYEQYKAGAKFSSYKLPNVVFGTTTITKTDLIRQLWLDNDFYGQVLSFQYKKQGDEVIVGGGWNRYDGKHFGEIIWANTGIPKNYRWYNLDALKTDENVYAKWQHKLNSRLQLFGDLQYRHVDYNINGFRNNPKVNVERNFNFINPKAGLTYTGNNWIGYLSYALANKEPNRSDFEAGITTQPKHETLHDFEIGAEKKKSNYTIGATAYYMLYRNQLVLTGKVNDVGAYTRENIPESYRLGLELQAAAVLTNRINIVGNISLSENKIKSSTEYIDNYDNGIQKTIVHNNKTISFSPSIVSAATTTFIPVKNVGVSLLSKYVSRQYLDNTQNNQRSLKPYYVQDILLKYQLKNKLFNNAQVIAQVNNLFNKNYEPNGYTFSYIYNGTQTTENYYYPMAGTNVMLGVNIKL
jgi:iron complex outermembrane receptor protein